MRAAGSGDRKLIRGLFGRNWNWIGPGAVVALVAVMGLSSAIGFVLNLSHQSQLAEHEAQTRLVRAFQTAMIDAETGVRGYVLTGSVDYLQPFYSGIKTLTEQAGPLLAVLDGSAERRVGAAGQSGSASAVFADLRRAWDAAIHLTSQGKRREAEAALQSTQSKQLMDRMRADLARYLEARAADAAQTWQDIYVAHVEHLVINIGGALFAIGGLSWAFFTGRRAARGRERAVSDALRASRQVEQLFTMADMLQSAVDPEDMNAVLSTTAMEMLPEFAGAMYVFSNSRDRLDLAVQWGDGPEIAREAYFVPDGCWALKRGKTNFNPEMIRALRCPHAPQGRATLEVPMAARGELYGMLEFSTAGEGATGRLAEARRTATALGDAMSLALASAALRDRLRNQAIRDGLTGLYNRRFLEETLTRMVLDAERRDVLLSAVMIDLDHFKRLNDTHGHAVGDAVLREVATTIVHCLRVTDVACRYGGEELLVLLPDCSLAMAEKKADQIRLRIAEIAIGDGVAVTASLGVASLPESVPYAADLVAAADAALYRAKQSGRNRVVAAAAHAAQNRGTDRATTFAVEASEEPAGRTAEIWVNGHA